MTYEEQKEIMKVVIGVLDSTPFGVTAPSVWTVPEGYKVERFTLNHVPVEHLIPEKKNGKVVYQLHGGGFVVALLDIYRDVAVRYSQMLDGAEVFTIDYRVAPTDLAPAALEDTVMVYQWLLEQGYKAENIIFAGDSAGGNLVLATTLFLKDKSIPMPKGVIALSPWASIESNYPSTIENKEKDLLLGCCGVKMRTEVYKSPYFQKSNVKEPYNSPVYGDFKGFPSLLIICGSYEVLRDDSVKVAEAAKNAGVDVKFIMYEGQSHVFPLVIPQEEASIEAWEEMKKFAEKIFAE